jgi:hypothetical protein
MAAVGQVLPMALASYDPGPDTILGTMHDRVLDLLGQWPVARLQRMIARNSNKMSERSSRLDIASNRISRAACDVDALAP